MRAADEYALLAADVFQAETRIGSRVARLAATRGVITRNLGALARRVPISPLDLAAREVRLLTLSDHAAVEERARELDAYENVVESALEDHRAWRHARKGNVMYAIAGPTGTGKSSCALGFLERFAGLTAANVRRRVFVDPRRLMESLIDLEPGSGVLLDEETELVGEGSATTDALLRNMEEQIRQSQIDVLTASPVARERSVLQAEWRAIGADFERRASFGVVWVDTVPVCSQWLPWCSDALWSEYSAMKRENVDRVRRGMVHDPTGAFRHAVALLDAPMAKAFRRSLGELKPADWRLVIPRVLPSLSIAERDGVISTVALCQKILSERDVVLWEEIFGEKVPVQLVRDWS